MTAPKDPGEARLALESEVDFAGYDPYIVALTGGGPANIPSITRSADHSRESRKALLMDWLRKQGG